MYISLITVGQLKEKYWMAACAEYEKRLRPYHKLTIFEFPDEKDPSDGCHSSTDVLLKREEMRIRQRLLADTHLIALDIQGKHFSSVSLANHITNLESRCITHLTFLIGGSNGLSEDLLKDTQERWSFSDLTFPHQLMRVLFLEQLYRISRIAHNAPYHK